MKNIAENWQSSSSSYVAGDFIKIETDDKPDVLAAISANELISLADVQAYQTLYPHVDFVCGYRTTCIWHGDAISFAQEHSFGWGSLGTLNSAISNDTVRKAQHKVFAFADNLISQFGKIETLKREYDRVYTISLWGQKTFRMAMLADYEPTADGVRSTWKNFGKVDVIWNINPNGNPTKSAIEAGAELGCEVLKWESFKDYMKSL